MSYKTLGFGIIGCGMIAKWHADAVINIPGTRLVGATDVNEDSRTAFTRNYDIQSFNRIEELLNSSEIDVVCICTPSGLHAPIAIQAANAGKHIVIEKPMAITLKEVDDVIAACENNHVKLAVISQLRFTNAIRKLKRAVDNGQLGKIVTGDLYMKFYRSQEYYDKGGWRGTWKMDGGGALMNQGIHGIDLLQYVMGPVKTVFAHTRTLARKIEVEDTASAIVEFENGALGIIQGTTSVYPGSPRRLEINGDKGSIILEEDSIISWQIEGEAVPQEITLEGTSTSTSNNPGAFSIDGHVRQLTDLVEAIHNNRQPIVDQYEGKKPIEIIMAIYESSRNGNLIKLD